jgi:hypothetical protein
MKRLMLCGAMLLAVGAVACNRGDNRTDAAVAAEVRHDLARKQVPGVIDVVFIDGTATLSGTVPDAATKDRAAIIADEVNGVDRVVNNLRTTTAADAPMRPDMGAPAPGLPIPPRNAPGMGAAPIEPAPNAPAPIAPAPNAAPDMR